LGAIFQSVSFARDAYSRLRLFVSRMSSPQNRSTLLRDTLYVVTKLPKVKARGGPRTFVFIS
jgi:hypothetical protein